MPGSASKLQNERDSEAVPLVSTRRRSRRFRSDTLLPILVLSPSLAAVAIFIYAFVIWTGHIALVRWNDLRPDYAFVGVHNLVRLFDTDRFQIDLHNTVTFFFLFLAESIVVGFLLAAFLDQGVKGEAILRTIYLLPFAVSAIVTGVAWRWLMFPGSGINLLFKKVGLGFIHPSWFADPNIGIAAVTIAASWQMSGYAMALYLAGLRTIPAELRETAQIDGAGSVAYYRHVAIPMLMPVTFTSFVILGTIALRLFDLTASMTSSGPAYADDTLAFFMFQTTFQSNHFSQGAAIAIVMLFFASCLTVPYLLSIRSEVER
jgi:glucose/mannose transport system permease protein